MRCVVVGNAPMIKSIGHIIDDHDIVVRMNVFETCEAIGNRTTDWWIGCARNMQVIFAHKFNTSELRCVYMYGREVLKQNLQHPNVRITGRMRRSLCKGIDKWATTGYIAIKWYLQYFDEISIAGFGPADVSLVGRMSPSKAYPDVDKLHKLHTGVSRSEYEHENNHDFNRERELIAELNVRRLEDE